MATKQELQKQIEEIEKSAHIEGNKLIAQGRQVLHDAVAKQNELRAQITKLESETNNNGQQ